MFIWFTGPDELSFDQSLFSQSFLRYFIKIAKNLHHCRRGSLPLTKVLNTKVGSNFFLISQLPERLMLSLYGLVIALILKIWEKNVSRSVIEWSAELHTVSHKKLRFPTSVFSLTRKRFIGDWDFNEATSQRIYNICSCYISANGRQIRFKRKLIKLVVKIFFRQLEKKKVSLKRGSILKTKIEFIYYVGI